LKTNSNNINRNNSNNMTLETDVILQLNMGFNDGPRERKMDNTELSANHTALKCHMCNVLSELSDLDNLNQMQRIWFKSLEVGEWTSCDYGSWASLTPTPPVSYNLQLTATIQHATPLSFATVAAIIEAIYDNGASCPMSFEDDDYYFLYPYHSIISDLDDGICCGH